MRRLICTLIAIGAAQVAHAQAPATGPVLSLDDAVRLAVKNNPQFLQSTTARTRAGAALRSAYGALVPSLQTSFGSSFREGRAQNFGGQSIGATSDLLISSGSLDASLRLSRATLLAPRLQRANLDAAEADVVSAAATLRSNVITQYLNVLQAMARASFADTLLRNTQAQLELARARQQVGAATTLDVRRAEVAVGQQQVSVLRERNSVEVEKLRLFQQVGVEQPSDVQLSTQFALEEPKVQLNDLLEMARRQNPALGALRSRERSADVSVSSARSAYLPTLQLSTSLSGFAQQSTDVNVAIASSRSGIEQQRRGCLTSDSIRVGAGLGALGNCDRFTFTPAIERTIRDENSQFPFQMTRDPLSFSAQFSIPIFDGFTREQRVQEASATRNDARYRVRQQELQLTADVTSAYRNLVTAYQTVRLQEQNSVAAREALALSQERFRVGANTFVDVSQARSDYERAETDRINAIYDFHKAFAALESAVGRPLR